jgi:hypothetical protein
VKKNQKLLTAIFMGITATLTFCSAEEEAKFGHDLQEQARDLEYAQAANNDPEQFFSITAMTKNVGSAIPIQGATKQLSGKKNPALFAHLANWFHAQEKGEQPAFVPGRALLVPKPALDPALEQEPKKLDLTDAMKASDSNKMRIEFERLYYAGIQSRLPNSPEEENKKEKDEEYERAKEAQRWTPSPKFDFDVFSTNQTLRIPLGAFFYFKMTGNAKTKQGQPFATTNPDDWGFTKPEITNGENLRFGVNGYGLRVNENNEIAVTIKIGLKALKRGTSRFSLDKKEDGSSDYWVDIVIE